MNRHNRTYGDIPCINTGDVDEPLQGIATARAKFINECWCGNRKHAAWIVCSICQTVVENTHG
jgi:hypothetical protein